MSFARERGAERAYWKWRNQTAGFRNENFERNTYCPLCRVSCDNVGQFESHRRETWHMYNFHVDQFQKLRKRKVKDRHGIEVKTHCTMEEVEYNDKDGTVKSVITPETEEVVYQFQVSKNVTSKECKIKLLDVFLLHPYEIFKLKRINEDEEDDDKEDGFAKTGQSYVIQVHFSNFGIGTYGVPVVFSFTREEVGKKIKQFDIIRVMVINVVGQEHLPTEKWSPFECKVWENINFTVLGTTQDGRPIRRITGYSLNDQHELMFEHWLGPYAGISEEACAELFHVMSVALEGYPVLKNHYPSFFHSLLYLEEFDATRAIEHYNMSNVQLSIVRDPDRLELEVPGLAEKRPSLIKGDLIYVRVHYPDGSTEDVEYEGMIVEVLDSVVWLCGFAPELLYRVSNENLSFDVRFSFSRFPIYVMHRAIDLVVENGLIDVLFPEDISLNPPLLKDRIDQLKLFNTEIESNHEQVSAIKNILQGECRPAPYIIFGPPGTGKTVTVVESVLQVKKMFSRSHVLVCAPSNAACDILALKLAIHCLPSELLRLHSSSREWKTVPEGIHKFSNRSECVYYFPALEDMVKYRIIVCTLITASRLVPLLSEEQRPHFTHVFIDECGQAQEPESLVALGGILGPVHDKKIGGQVILAGDPKQLGPVCQSRRAEKVCLRRNPPTENSDELDELTELNNRKGLGVSLLERLMITCLPYQKDSDNLYDNRYITKLLHNYRSHPSILYLSNKLFYGNELKYMCPESVLNDPIRENPLFGKNKKNKKGCPIVFHGVLGHERREGRSPSYFNTYEVDQIIMYLERLFETEKVQQSEIGIIAPYIRQVYKLKKKLEERNWNEIECGTTEIFQGREKRVVIISAVRANRNLLNFDHKFQLGFLSNPKRFNVAITRAQSLLIVIANPFMVSKDPNWLELMQYSMELGSYTGCRFQEQDIVWAQQVISKGSKLSKDD